MDLAPYTSARIGGPADVLLEVHSKEELVDSVRYLWDRHVAFRILGGGSNVLIADRGVRSVVILNRAREVHFSEDADTPVVVAQSGASLGVISRRAVERGLSGLEWAATIPGTIGGAIVGNAGAHGGDVAGSLILAEILQQDTAQIENFSAEQMDYEYRSSMLKVNPGTGVVLSGTFGLEKASRESTRQRMHGYVQQRKNTQPHGASWGSMFKNPPGDAAGRLIEMAGLKGLRRGDAEISLKHANFFINHGKASASEVAMLILEVQEQVLEKFEIELELEVEMIGDWGYGDGTENVKEKGLN
jgi:UDP-N-acetylmuramate dehydrogenase